MMNQPGRLPPPEHVALLEHPNRFDSLHRKDDFLDEGVHTVFGVTAGRAELQAFFFQADKFTPIEARDWLRERGFRPLLFTGLTENKEIPAAQHGDVVPRSGFESRTNPHSGRA